MVVERETGRTSEGKSGTDLPEAERSSLPRLRGKRAADGISLSTDLDLTRTANGFSQMRKDENLAARQTGTRTSVHHDRTTQDAAKARKDDAQRSYEAWAAQMTTVDGLQMTNGEALKARKGVAENAETYARWAVAKSHLKPEDKERFIENARRLATLEERIARGEASADERREYEVRRQDPTTGALDKAARHYHEAKGRVPEVETRSVGAVDRVESTARPPVLTEMFAAAHDASTREPEKRAPAPTAPQVANTGLNL